MKIKKNNVLTLTANGDVKFTEVWFTSTSSTYAKAIRQSLQSFTGITIEIVDDVVVIVKFEEPTAALTFTSSVTSRIASIKVIY